MEGCPAAEGVQLGIGVTTPGSVPVGTQCWACDYTNGIKPDRFNIVDINYQSTADTELACVEQYFTGPTRRNLQTLLYGDFFHYFSKAKATGSAVSLPT